MHITQPKATINNYFFSIEKLSNLSMLRLVLVFAAFSFFCTLFLPSVGEEGVYTNSTLEMLHNENYVVPTLLGTQYSRPPLFNWLILAVTQILGPAKIVIAARLVNMLMTIATAGCLVAFVRQIFHDKKLSLWAGAIYLSGDLLFKRGWLAYADSLFALCIFMSIASLWLALDKKQRIWYVGACISLCCAFLAKVHTAYIFYAISGAVLLWRHPNRKFLFIPSSWVLHTFAILFPIAWTMYANHGYGGVGTTWLHSQSFLVWPGWLPYLLRVLLTYPLDIALRFMPISLIALGILFNLRANKNLTAHQAAIQIIFWITVLNLLPYWLAPHGNIRYILPMYPLIAFLIAYVIWQAGSVVQRLAIKCLIGTVILKYIFAVGWLPYEQNIYRGNAAAVAEDILLRTQSAELYVNDSTSAGMRVTVELNKMRYPQAPVVLPPVGYSGYLLAENANDSLGQLVSTYTLHKKQLYLYRSFAQDFNG